jgi:hypothetical protein
MLCGLSASLAVRLIPRFPPPYETRGLLSKRNSASIEAQVHVQQTCILEESQNTEASFMKVKQPLSSAPRRASSNDLISVALHQDFALTAPPFVQQVSPMIVPPAHAIALLRGSSRGQKLYQTSPSILEQSSD